MRFENYTAHNYKSIPQIINNLTPEHIHNIDIVSRVLPFKTNNYVANELIDWSNYLNDPMFILNFPQHGMLKKEHYSKVELAIKNNLPTTKLNEIIDQIRKELNPHPAGQMEHNVPFLGEQRLSGLQHKYHETVLFFAAHSQSCHAHCTFCFRWPQFVNMQGYRFSSREIESLIAYLKLHPEVTDILFTGGDSLIMSAEQLNFYIEPILKADLPHIQSIRFGTKTLTYWPFRFTSDKDADDLLRVFDKIAASGRHVAFMAHINHPKEMAPTAFRDAVKRVRNTGAEIRAQAPLMQYINDSPEIWRDMWNEQVKLGIIPYYMFVARDTGAQHYFAVSLERAWHIFRDAYQQVSGLARTVRGPSMSAGPGKVHVIGVTEIQGQKVFVLQFLQGRNADWALKPFFAQYDPNAIWLNDLKPAFGESEFFFEKEYKLILHSKEIVSLI